MKPIKIAIAVVLLFTACQSSQESVINTPEPGPNTEVGLSYLALGDSYTIGQSVAANERWPVILAKELQNMGRQVKSPDIIAVTGWTTANLLAALDARNIAIKYDLVSLLIGVNNQYQGLSLDQYRIEFRALLIRSIGYAKGGSSRVFVLSIPDWGATPYGSGTNTDRITQEIDQFNAVAKEECEKLSVSFVNITPTSRLALNDLTMVANDQLHYSGKMHQLWVNEALPLVKQKLK
jgi:acyl-CoA thioesterase-1